MTLCLLYFDRLELAGLKAHPAPSTFFGIDFKGFSGLLLRLLLAGDGLSRTGLNAFATPLADIRENSVSEQCLTDLRRTSLIDNMFFIFALEVSEGGEDGIGSRCSQLAERGLCCDPSQFLQKVDVIRGSSSL